MSPQDLSQSAKVGSTQRYLTIPNERVLTFAEDEMIESSWLAHRNILDWTTRSSSIARNMYLRQRFLQVTRILPGYIIFVRRERGESAEDQ
jgi:hypothetical protein